MSEGELLPPPVLRGEWGVSVWAGPVGASPHLDATTLSLYWSDANNKPVYNGITLTLSLTVF